MNIQESQNGNNLVKYFVHGIPFAILSVLFVYVLDFVLLMMLTGSPSGVLMLAFVILLGYFLTIGAVNIVAAELVWGIRAKRSVKSFLGQGFLFTVMLFLIDPFLYAVVFAFTATLILDLVLLTVSFVILAFVGGYIGRNIAVEFVGERERSDELASIHDRQMTCRHCGAQTTVKTLEVEESGGFTCSECGRWNQVSDRGPSID
ncbi:hypothetical protein EU538_02715 [Candidatus Thorarchaeota archaeon]|nr:MAG: hypothetical protein EU538_02715 [Candidatus Thorarchaeota archaeon]